ncbi:MAG: hypothetical protein U0Q18_19945 [Bryobacteraceae bacterium]
MDLQVYYKRIRDIEESLKGPSVVVVSQETPDGGREGVRTEVSRRVAAKMLVEGVARIATEEETAAFLSEQAEAKKHAEQAAAAARVQFALLSPNELRNLKNPVRQDGK